MEALFSRLSNDFVLICVYLVLALSLNLINGYAGLFSLGHAGFWAVGAYCGSAFIIYSHQAGPGIPGALLFCGGITAAMGGAALVGLIVGLPSLRLQGDYLAIASLGFSLIVVNILNNLAVVGGASSFPFGGLVWPDGALYDLKARVAHNLTHIVLGVLAVGTCTLVIRNIRHSSHGRAILSLREDEVASAMCGVNVVKYKLLVFVLGAAFAGLAGVLYATYTTRIAPEAFNFMESVKILLMVVLGGLGSLSGTFIAVIVLYEVPELLRMSHVTIAGSPVADWWVMLYALVLVMLMILRPQGLLGSKELFECAGIRRLFGMAGRGGREA